MMGVPLDVQQQQLPLERKAIRNSACLIEGIAKTPFLSEYLYDSLIHFRCDMTYSVNRLS